MKLKDVDFSGTPLDYKPVDHEALERAIMATLLKRPMPFGMLYANLADTFYKFREDRDMGIIEVRIKFEKQYLRNALNRLKRRAEVWLDDWKTPNEWTRTTQYSAEETECG